MNKVPNYIVLVYVQGLFFFSELCGSLNYVESIYPGVENHEGFGSIASLNGVVSWEFVACR